MIENSEKKNKKEKNKRKVKIFEKYTVLLFIFTLFMGIAYADVTDIKLKITGGATADSQQGLFISDIKSTDTSVGVISEEVKYYKGTTMSSSIQLSSAKNSNLIYRVTLYNNSTAKYYFKEIAYIDEAYDNKNIIHTAETLEPYITTIEGKGSTLEFDLSFKYKDGITISSTQELNSVLNIVFSNEMIEFKLGKEKYDAQSGATWEQFINSNYNTYGFKIVEDKIYTSDDKEVYLLSEPVKPTDVIEAKTYNYKPEITLNQNTIEISKITGTNEIATLTATVKNTTESIEGKLTWESSNTDAVEVTGNGSVGTLTIKSAGFAIVTVKYGEITSECQVIVREKMVIEIANTSNGTLSDYRIYGNSIQYGIPQQDAPVEIQSVGEKRYSDTSIYEGALINSMCSSSGAVNYSANNQYAGIDKKIAVEGGRIYEFAVEGLTESQTKNIYYGQWDAEGKFLGRTQLKNGKAIRVDKNAKELFIYFYSSGFELTGNQKITILTYEYVIPIKVSNGTEEYTTEIILNEPLRKAGNYVDYVDFSTGLVKRYVTEVKALDLTWTLLSSVNDCYRYEATMAESSLGENAKLFISGQTTGLLSDSFKTEGYWDNIKNSISERTNSNYLRILTDKYSTLNDLKNSLGNIKILYVLATPKEETFEIPSIPTLNGTTTIEINTEIPPSSMPIINLDKDSIELEVESGSTVSATEELTATLVNITGDLAWTSSDTNVAEISGEGNTRTITLKSVGQSTIAASCGDLSATCAVNVREAGPSLKTFTIDGVEYQAEDWMSWFEWCNSPYNTDGFSVNFGETYFVRDSAGGGVVYRDIGIYGDIFVPVSEMDTIEEGDQFYIQRGTSIKVLVNDVESSDVEWHQDGDMFEIRYLGDADVVSWQIIDISFEIVAKDSNMIRILILEEKPYFIVKLYTN